jgi:Protein of unknown function (Hypoth_ymh)
VVEDGPDTFYATERLQRGLHPMIESKARPQFLLGEYKQGVFAAMKAVEVRVRNLARFGNDVVGVDLMNQLFGPKGPLRDVDATRGNRREPVRSSPVPTQCSAIPQVEKSTTTMWLRRLKPY